MADNNYVTGRYTICKIDGTDYVSLTDLGLEGMAESVSGRTKGNLKGQVTCRTNVNWNFNGSMTIVGENEEETYKLRDKIMGLVGEIVEFEYFTCIDPSAEIIAPVDGTAINKGTCFIASYSESSQMDDNLTCTFSANIQGERLAESNLISLDVNAGLFDFSYTSDYLEKWVFEDGSESTELRPSRTLATDQTVKLYVTSFNGELYANDTATFFGDIEQFRNMTNLVNVYSTGAYGDVSNLSNITYYAGFGNTSVSGDIVALSNLTFYANFRGTNVVGDIAALSNLTNYADFWNTGVSGDIVALKNITERIDLSYTTVNGDISVLTKATYINLRGTQVTGALNPTDLANEIFLYSTSMSEEDTLQSLRNMDANFTTTVARSIQLKNNIDQSSVEVITLVDSLTNKGCTVAFG